MTIRLVVASRLLLANNQITQRDLARQWGCSVSTVSRFIAGESLPEPSTLLRIFQWMLLPNEIQTPQQKTQAAFETTTSEHTDEDKQITGP